MFFTFNGNVLDDIIGLMKLSLLLNEGNFIVVLTFFFLFEGEGFSLWEGLLPAEEYRSRMRASMIGHIPTGG